MAIKKKDDPAGYQREPYHRWADAVHALLGRKCVRCGFADRRALQIDHIHGGGNKRRKLLGVNGELKHILRVGGEGYQLLCANCNWIKRFENKENENGR